MVKDPASKNQQCIQKEKPEIRKLSFTVSNNMEAAKDPNDCSFMEDL
jgi:hypothetical protein